MARPFVIADLHFGHAKVQTLRGITDDDLVERWNAVVSKRDVVYVLGDVFRLDRVPELNGTKKLALGNHDKYPAASYLQHFTQVRAMFEYDGCLLTHIPVHRNQSCRYRRNVHGHMHANRILIANGVGGLHADPFYVCVSAERTGFAPVSLDEVCRG